MSQKRRLSLPFEVLDTIIEFAVDRIIEEMISLNDGANKRTTPGAILKQLRNLLVASKFFNERVKARKINVCIVWLHNNVVVVQWYDSYLVFMGIGEAELVYRHYYGVIELFQGWQAALVRRTTEHRFEKMSLSTIHRRFGKVYFNPTLGLHYFVLVVGSLKRKDYVKFLLGIGGFLNDLKTSITSENCAEYFEYHELTAEYLEQFGIVDIGEFLSVVEDGDSIWPDRYWTVSHWSYMSDSGSISSTDVAPDVTEWWCLPSGRETTPFFSGCSGTAAWVFDVDRQTVHKRSNNRHTQWSIQPSLGGGEGTSIHKGG